MQFPSFDNSANQSTSDDLNDQMNLFAMGDMDADDYNIITDSNIEALLELADDLEIAPMTKAELEHYLTSLHQQFEQTTTLYTSQHLSSSQVELNQLDFSMLEMIQILGAKFSTESSLYADFISLNGLELFLSIISTHHSLDILIATVSLLLDLFTETDLLPNPEPKKSRDLTFLTPCHCELIKQKELKSRLDEFGPSWTVLLELFRLNGFKTLFSFILIMNDEIGIHRDLVGRFLSLIELLIENDLALHSLLKSHLLPFLTIRSSYNTSVMTTTEDSDLINEMKNALSVDEKQQKVLKCDEMLSLLTPDPEPLSSLTPNRSYAIELIASIASLDQYCFVQWATACTFVDITQANKTTTTSDPFHSSQPNPFIDILHHFTLNTRHDLQHAVFLSPPDSSVFLTLLNLLQCSLVFLSSPQATSITKLKMSEITEYIANLFSVVKSALSETRIHEHTLFFPQKLSTWLLLHYGFIATPSLHYHTRLLWFSWQGGSKIAIPGLKSKLCMETLQLIEAGCDGDLILQQKLQNEQQNDSKQSQTITNDQYYWGIICDDLIERGALGLLFGYLGNTPSGFKSKEEKEDFSSALIKIHSHLLLNSANKPHSLCLKPKGTNTTQPSPLQRIVAKYRQNGFQKLGVVVGLLQEGFKNLFAQVIQSQPDLEKIFGYDIYLGYSYYPSKKNQIINSDDVDDDDDDNACPEFIEEKVVFARQDEQENNLIKIPTFIQSLATYLSISSTPGFSAISRYCLVIIAVYVDCYLTELSLREENKTTGVDLDHTFGSFFSTKNSQFSQKSQPNQNYTIKPSVVSNVIGELCYYAGNESDFGIQIGTMLEYFIPFVELAMTSQE